MRITVLLFAIALAITPVCRGQQMAQHQINPREATITKSGAELTPDPNFTGKAPEVLGILADAGDPDTSKAKTGDDKAKTGASKAKAGTAAKKDTAGAKSTYLSPDKGIGPIKGLKLGSIDTSMVSKGQAFFQGQCVVCHQLDKKKIGAPLRNVTKERPPEFIMNMLLNTDEMEKKDPEVKKLIGQYGTYMSILDIKQDQARQLLEYLRWAATQPPDK